jgi:hypothetical protein
MAVILSEAKDLCIRCWQRIAEVLPFGQDDTSRKKMKGGFAAALQTFTCLLDHSIFALSTWMESPFTVPVTAM